MHSWIVKLKHIKQIIVMQDRVVVKAREEKGSCNQEGTWFVIIAPSFCSGILFLNTDVYFIIMN